MKNKKNNRNKIGIWAWMKDHVRPSVNLNGNSPPDDLNDSTLSFGNKINNLKDKLNFKISFKWRF